MNKAEIMRKAQSDEGNKTVITIGKAGGIMLGGALIALHIAASAVGALVCAIARE